MKPFCVRAVRCDHRATEEEIYATLVRITAPLARSWQRLTAAQTIVVKTNMVWPPNELRYLAGRRQEHVDDAVFRCVLRLLRERTTARILVADTTLLGPDRPGRDVNFLPILEEFGATYVECNDGPVGWFDVPGGGILFGRYIMHRAVGEADALVSVAKLKNHAFAGVTMSTKNLFGLCPLPPLGRTRMYFHHLARLSAFLADLGRLLHPCLNIVDGLVGQSGREWGGQGHVCDALIAGDHPIATDTCGAYLMGHDPASDWPTPPLPPGPQHHAGGGGTRVRHGEPGRYRLRHRSATAPGGLRFGGDRPAGDRAQLAALHLRASASLPRSPRTDDRPVCRGIRLHP